MSTFWKGFGIFWIIFLIWYLTGGPQRVTLDGARPITTFDSNRAGVLEDSKKDDNSTTEENSLNLESQIKSDKSFPNQLKTNTINVSN